jgi:hypothetical protein
LIEFIEVSDEFYNISTHFALIAVKRLKLGISPKEGCFSYGA